MAKMWRTWGAKADVTRWTASGTVGFYGTVWLRESDIDGGELMARGDDRKSAGSAKRDVNRILTDLGRDPIPAKEIKVV